jgi:hypothetical protein
MPGRRQGSPPPLRGARPRDARTPPEPGPSPARRRRGPSTGRRPPSRRLAGSPRTIPRGGRPPAAQARPVRRNGANPFPRRRIGAIREIATCYSNGPRRHPGAPAPSRPPPSPLGLPPARSAQVPVRRDTERTHFVPSFLTQADISQAITANDRCPGFGAPSGILPIPAPGPHRPDDLLRTGPDARGGITDRTPGTFAPPPRPCPVRQARNEPIFDRVIRAESFSPKWVASPVLGRGAGAPARIASVQTAFSTRRKDAPDASGAGFPTQSRNRKGGTRRHLAPSGGLG